MTLARPVRRLRSAIPVRRHDAKTPSYVLASAVAIGALAAMALVNRHLAKKAERENPAAGRFLDVDGVRLHYVERGSGEPLVLLHGNGSMIEDFESSGLIDLAARNYRVIVFDRPGFGHSDRPRNVVWTPDAQAELINHALERLDVSNAIVLGHSWGASVAVALALKYPDLVRGLVLASGYYYPTARPDVIAMGAPALPLIGDILSHTLSPLISRAIWPLMMAKIFGPPICAGKVRSVSEGDGAASFSDPGIGRRIGADDSGRLQAAQSVRGSEDARRHHCGRAGQADRHRHAVGPAAFRYSAKQISPNCRKRPHDPADRDGSGDVGNTRGGGRPYGNCQRRGGMIRQFP